VTTKHDPQISQYFIVLNIKEPQMRKLLIFYTITFLLLLCNNAFAAADGFGATGLTGGTSGKLDAIDITLDGITDADVCVVHTNGAVYNYYYDDDNGSTEASPDYIAPDKDNGAGYSGNGRWVLQQMYSYVNIWISPNEMTALTTNGAASGTNEYATNDIMVPYFAFDDATEEFVAFSMPMPEGWNRSTIKAKFFWSSATSSTAGDTVEWEIQAGALTDNDAIDAALGTGQVISDTLLANNGTDLQVTSATPATTVGGTPALGDLVHFKISRNVGGTDDMVEDAWLFGVWIQIAQSKAVVAW
jgi:hypothetical protein